MTETSPVTHFQTEEGSILGSCGFPVPNTLSKIVDVKTGKLLGPDQVYTTAGVSNFFRPRAVFENFWSL